MARFHNAVAQLPPLAQRDGAYPLDTLPARPVDEDLRPALDALEADLAAIDHPTAPRQVIHGDFTAQNVLACGRPPAVCGVIDFALSYVEVVWADIGFGLWRSGRPHQDAIHLDLDRVQDLISGYCRVRALPPQAVRAIAVYATARGLQQAVKGYGHGRRPPPMLMDRVQWLATHYNQLEDRIGRATTHE
jgi:Ser/Thr protein kinase RdoA (MazF antagonist)